MNDLGTGLSAGALSAAVLEFIKWVYRKFVIKNMDYQFPEGFYVVGIPVLSVLLIPVLAFLGVSNYTMPTDWLGFAKGAAIVLLSSLVSLVTYTSGISPLKAYGKELKAKKDFPS